MGRGALTWVLLLAAATLFLVQRWIFWRRVDGPLRAKNRAPMYPLYPWRKRAALDDCREVLGDERTPRLILALDVAFFAAFVGALLST